MFEKFSSQKSDDVFVEAAINPGARQEYIDKLVEARVMFTHVLILVGIVFLFNLSLRLFMPLLIPSLPPRSGLSRSLDVFGLITLGFTFVSFLMVIVSNDWQIKFLKALEAGTTPATPGDGSSN